MTGMDLRLKRIAAEVRLNELAQAMGVSSSRVSHIENRRTVTPEATDRYLRALVTCSTKSTGGEAVA